MVFKYLITQNNKPICFTEPTNMMNRIKNLSKKQFNSYEDYIIYYVDINGELNNQFILSIGFRETGFKYFINQKMIEEKKLEELFCSD